MTQSTTLLTAADYADALTTARRAKTTLCFLLIFALGTQLTLFFMLRYWPKLDAVTAFPPAEDAASVYTRQLVQYGTGLLDFAGLILPGVLVVLLLVILLVQLVGRLVGTARVTSALCWAVLVALLLFPWQAVLNNPGIRADPYASAIGLKVPGILYTWAEVSHPTMGAKFTEINVPTADKLAAGLHWLRYAGFPLFGIIVLALIHTLSERGIRQSMGPVVLTAAGSDLADQLETPASTQI